MVRTRFDQRIHIGRPMVAATEFLYDGVEYQKGDPFPVDDLHRTKVAAMYGARRINFADDGAAPADTQPHQASPVTIDAQPGGYYLISAPWLDEPERVRGKAAAETRQAEIETEGAPLGFIAGGTLTTIEESGGGWYDVSAPWLDEPIKAQGHEAAQAEQLALHEAGEPDSHHGYTLTASENGWYQITRTDDPAETPVALNVQGEDKAREAIATLRRGELIEGTALPGEWAPLEPLKVGDVVIVPEDAEGPLAGLTATIEKIDGEIASLAAFKGEGDDAELIKVEAPLASLTLADTTVNEGSDDETHEDEDEAGEQTGEPGADNEDASLTPADGTETTKESNDGQEQNP